MFIQKTTTTLYPTCRVMPMYAYYCLLGTELETYRDEGYEFPLNDNLCNLLYVATHGFPEQYAPYRFKVTYNNFDSKERQEVKINFCYTDDSLYCYLYPESEDGTREVLKWDIDTLDYYGLIG